jgi:hypothetical protein
MPLPPCGLYRTTKPLNDVPSGRLVYFHNHGDPGAGIYLPSDWKANRATWQSRGNTIPDEAWASSLEPLPAEGLYRVSEDFFCCEKQCVKYPKSQLVQLGYDGEANAILFVPEWTARGLSFPERGNRLDRSRFSKLEPLSVAQGAESPKDAFVH